MIGASSSGIDQSVVNWFNDRAHASTALVRAAEVVTWFGNALVLTVIVLIAAVVLLARRQRWSALFVAATASVGGLVNSGVKEFVGRARPVVEHPVAIAMGKSFPSGHALSSTVVYGVLLVVFLPVVPKRWQAVAIATTATLVLAIGVSRVVLGVHYPSDVVVGHLLGLALVIGSTALFSAKMSDYWPARRLMERGHDRR